MAKYAKSTTLNLPTALIQKLLEAYDDELDTIKEKKDLSAAIRFGLTDALSLELSELDMERFALHQLLSFEENMNRVDYCVRLSEELYTIIHSYSEKFGLTMQETAENMLAKQLYHSAKSRTPETKELYTPPKSTPNPCVSDSLKSEMKLLRIFGSKWDARIHIAIKKIFDSAGMHWDLSVEVCAGALGIHANFNIAETEIINDDDTYKINLYRQIQKNHRELFIKAMTLEVNRQTFEKVKELERVSKTPDIHGLVRYLFLNLTSYKNKGNTFRNGTNNGSYQKQLRSIYSLHERLKKTKILEMDIFKVLDKYMRDDNVLFIVDPPYYLCDDAYKNRRVLKEDKNHGKRFGLKEHQRLAKMLRKTHACYRNDFIFFCRLTATRKKNRKNQIISTVNEILERDRHIEGTIDDLYRGYGFYYIDVSLDEGTIERIITTFTFDGATEYGSKKERSGKATDISEEFANPDPRVSLLTEMGVK